MSKSLIVSLAASLVVLAGCANPPRSVERLATPKSSPTPSTAWNAATSRRSASTSTAACSARRTAQTLWRLQTGRRQTLASQGCCSRGRPGGR